jgi:hypothetical protein
MHIGIMGITELAVKSSLTLGCRVGEPLPDKFKKAGRRCGCISNAGLRRMTTLRFIVHTHDIPTAFSELPAAIHRQVSAVVRRLLA